eukprot:11203751-Lingulodinium_polyedra.AAC.1
MPSQESPGSESRAESDAGELTGGVEEDAAKWPTSQHELPGGWRNPRGARPRGERALLNED